MISNMTEENIYYILGNEFTIWSASILERCADLIVYPLALMVISIILYYPFIFTLFEIYVLTAIFFVWKKIGNLPEDINSKKWDKPKKILTLVVKWHGKILHGYEVSGVENLPKEPAILVYYHGAFPIDNIFFCIRFIDLLENSSVLWQIIVFFYTRSAFAGISLLLALHYTVHTTRENVVNMLKQGHHVTVAPGGMREENYGNNHYRLIWGKRKGFAHTAINAKVPIVPVFTQNIREGYIAYGNIRPMRWLYERTRLLMFPLYGMFPVKLITHIGKPIPYDPDITAEELAEKTQRAIEALRDKHQKIPGNILHAIRQRFETPNKEKQ